MGLTSPFPEPESPELEQFIVYSRAEIAAMLRRLREANVPVNAYHDRADGLAVTEILDVLLEDDAVIIDPPSDPDAARELIAAEHVTFVAFVDNIKMQFAAHGVVAASWEGRTAARIRLPESVLRLQRREFFRVRPPISKPALCLIPYDPPAEREVPRKPTATTKQHYESLRVLDLSVGGLALLACPQALKLPHGEKIEGCFLDLPGVGSINLSVVVRNLDPIVCDDNRRLGCEFADLSPASRMALQRYVNKVEAEMRKALTPVA